MKEAFKWFFFLHLAVCLGPMQRMNVPRGMGPMGPGPQVITSQPLEAWSHIITHSLPIPCPNI